MPRVPRVVVSAVCLVGGLLAQAPTAGAIPVVDEPISGTVTAEATGQPLAGMCVTGEAVTIGDDFYFSEAVTDTAGHYQLDTSTDESSITFPPHWRIKFHDCAGGFHATEWYDDSKSKQGATEVSQGATGVDAALAMGGIIEGSLVDDLGQPAAGAFVSSYGPDGFSSSTSTDASGNYRLLSLPVGTYRIGFGGDFFDDYVGEYYDDKPDLASADPVTVVASTVTAAIDAEVVRRRTISGRVADDSTGQPVADVCLNAYTDGSGRVYQGRSDAAGLYTIPRVPAGTYQLEAQDCDLGRMGTDSEYATEWYEDKPDRASADPVTVAWGSDVPGIDFAVAAVGAGEPVPVEFQVALVRFVAGGNYGGVSLGPTMFSAQVQWSIDPSSGHRSGCSWNDLVGTWNIIGGSAKKPGLRGTFVLDATPGVPGTGNFAAELTITGGSGPYTGWGGTGTFSGGLAEDWCDRPVGPEFGTLMMGTIRLDGLPPA